jgi:hypothetical protein
MKPVLAFFLLMILWGCSGTPYQPSGLIGGYEERQLSANSFKVFFHGNGYTRGDRASDFTLLRSAEVAEQNGFPYFVIEEEEAPAASSRINRIVCFKEKPERAGVVYDAKSVQQSIKQKYGMNSAP